MNCKIEDGTSIPQDKKVEKEVPDIEHLFSLSRLALWWLLAHSDRYQISGLTVSGPKRGEALHSLIGEMAMSA